MCPVAAESKNSKPSSTKKINKKINTNLETVVDEENNIISSKKTERFREAKHIWINSDDCTRCGICMQVCPVNAISRTRN